MREETLVCSQTRAQLNSPSCRFYGCDHLSPLSSIEVVAMNSGLK